MPILIEEMTVQVEIYQSPQPAAAGQQAGQGAGGTAPAGGNATEQIRRCVDEVMEVIRQQNER